MKEKSPNVRWRDNVGGRDRETVRETTLSDREVSITSGVQNVSHILLLIGYFSIFLILMVNVNKCFRNID